MKVAAAGLGLALIVSILLLLIHFTATQEANHAAAVSNFARILHDLHVLLKR